ncbi:hypothetical protein [Acinetobacter terrae]|jgi:hypothetical protein|uniref:hypothetical protein n=1 Tax=Acinetobacter terrae TaxID=2731247 RepID=UPI0007D817B0|nr:hypothetical protein [Acinetobacter terrae]NNH16400.1 hypothetical protein [Acinetobacter terrae]OAL85470.1 hypothetical protein AY608_03345 [Acinetobacter terrae]
MSQYHKTDLGIESLKQRSMDLNARQRRLLLLIGTEDFNLLNEQFKHRIAPVELLEQLVEMGLIACSNVEQIQTTVSSPVVNSEIETSLSTQTTTILAEKFAEPITTTAAITPSISSIAEPISQVTKSQNEIQMIIEALDFEEVKQLMTHLLQQNCGLMAKQLTTRIQQTQDLRSLKLCQMQWITELQESRIPADELNQCLKQINFSLQKLNAS